MNFKNTVKAGLFLASLGAGQAYGQSHAAIDSTRSSYNKNMFIVQAVDGEYGKFKISNKDSTDLTTEGWKGYGIRNGFGLEVFKFTQFSLSHTLLNMRSNKDSLENLQGSRLAAEVAFSFSAPITNIQFGMGVAASQLNYRNFQESATFVGVGRYYTAGINYFMSPSISLQLSAKRMEVEHKANGGSAEVSTITADTDSLSLGFAVWL